MLTDYSAGQQETRQRSVDLSRQTRLSIWANSATGFATDQCPVCSHGAKCHVDNAQRNFKQGLLNVQFSFHDLQVHMLETEVMEPKKEKKTKTKQEMKEACTCSLMEVKVYTQ